MLSSAQRPKKKARTARRDRRDTWKNYKRFDCWENVFPGREPVFLNGVLERLLHDVKAVLHLGALPLWPYSSGWGYYPSGGLGLILLIVIILLLTGRL
jgi:hypothetical protein